MKDKLKKKLVIGSANFEKDYGAVLTKVNSKEILKILNLAKKNNIYSIDTAKAYVENKKIFKNIDENFKIITKIKPNKKWISFNFCKNELDNHFGNFKKKKVESLLFHDEKILFKKEGFKIFENLKKLKKLIYF